MFKKFILLTLLNAFCFESQSQIDNALLENSSKPIDSMSNVLSLSVYENTFFKNNEYFEEITTGYTLFGTQLQTALNYMPNKNTKITAGLYLRKDFGQDNMNKIAPVFSIQLQKNGYRVIMGNIEGNVSHRLIEPIYNYERLMLNHLENGLQFKTEKQKFWSDTWINWEVMEYLGSNFQEQFSAGHSSELLLLKNKKGLQIKLPLQGLVTHQGGQIDIDTTALKTLVNVASGLVIEKKSQNEHAFITHFFMQNYVMLYQDLSPSKRQVFENGKAYYVNIGCKTKYDISLSAAYWSGNNYMAARGGELFQCAATSYGKPGYTEASRDLVLLRLLYQHRVFDALDVDVRFEPYYHLNKQLLSYSYSVYFTYKHDFSLLKLTNSKKKN
ncbi:MAG: hypothetical protein IPI46_04130 [Bacteroidetes bacterium]|nr:hypothetical protein [Bacteroidota bacterium]